MKKQNHLLSQSLHYTLICFLSFLTLTLILALFATPAHSAQVTLAWDPNSESDLAGYKLYYKTGSSGPPYNGMGADQGPSPISAPIGDLSDLDNPEYTLTGLNDSEIYFFALTAYDTGGQESGYSNEVNTEGTGRVTIITSTTDDGYYKAGDTVNITINFSEAATLAGGNLIATLDTGGTAVIGPFNSQTSASGIYTVEPGENSSDLNAESLELSQGATLQNNEGLDCDPSLPTGSTLADNKDIAIDTVAPSSSATAPTYGNSTFSITWTASDATSGVASTELWYKKGSGGTWANTGLDAQTGTSGTFSYIPTDGDGTYYFATCSTDNAFNREAEPVGNGDSSTVYDTMPPAAPTVSGTTPTNDTTPTWRWSSGGGNGTFRYKLDNSNLSSGATQTTTTSFTPGSALSEGSHTLYVQERDDAGNWSGSGTHTIVIDTTSPGAPTVSGTTPTNDTTPTWRWSSGGGNGTFRYKLDNSNLSSGATQTTTTSFTPASALSEGSHTLYVQERDDAGNWSGSGSYTIVIDITKPSDPVITTDGGNGPGSDYAATDSSIILEGTCAANTVAIYVNGSADGVTYTPGETSWTYSGTLESGANNFTITAYDAAGNVSSEDSITVTYGSPIGGYINHHVIPLAQVSQSTNGDGIITIRFKIKDPTNDPCTLHTFQYSVDGGNTWNTPANGDSSESLSSGWQDNGGDHYSSAADFDGAEEHSFTFNTKHGDVTGLDGTEQGDVQVRFTVNDGTYNSLSPVTSENFPVDNLGPAVDISYSEPGPYRDGDAITVTATFTEANLILGTPQIAIDYVGDDVDVSATDMTEVTNREWIYSMTVPSGHHGSATITITGVDGAGNPVGAHTGNTFTVSDSPPAIVNYPSIDYANNTIDITYSGYDMQNATEEANYRFSPSLNFATSLVDGDDITNPSGTTYRLRMASITAHTIFTLTVSNITDAEGNPVTPSSIRINDNDNDDIPDDWESDNGLDPTEDDAAGDIDRDGMPNLFEFTNGFDPQVDDSDLDADGDSLSNLEEYQNGTDPNDYDTDNDAMPDGWEVSYGLNPLDSVGENGKDGDLDNDGWTNYEEYMTGSNPTDDTPTPVISPPETVETIPHHNAGLNGDTARVPNDASFCARIEDSDGIDITDLESITFTISDGLHEPYTRDSSNETAVRVVKLTEEEDTQVTKLWAVYDRSKDDEYGNNYAFDSIITIGVGVQDRRGVLIDPVPSYTFKIESQVEHDYAHDPDNLPDTVELSPADPDLEDPEYVYDAGIQVNSGGLEGAKIIYNSNEPVTPRLGPTDEIPSLAGARGIPMNLQPSTVFNTPVKIFIPYPGRRDVSHLHVYLYNGTRWVRACDSKGNVRPGGDGWMVPGSRVDHNSRIPPTVEIKVYHFSAVQAKPDSDSSSPPSNASPSILDDAAVGGGGCLIATAAFASNMDRAPLLFGFILLLLTVVYCIKRSATSIRRSAIRD